MSNHIGGSNPLGATNQSILKSFNMKKILFLMVSAAIGVFLAKITPIFVQEKPSLDSSVLLDIHIQQCTGNTYTIQRKIPTGAYLKIDNYRVAVPELNVYGGNSGGLNNSYFMYGPIALNVCAFTIDTLK